MLSGLLTEMNNGGVEWYPQDTIKSCVLYLLALLLFSFRRKISDYIPDITKLSIMYVACYLIFLWILYENLL